MDLLQDFSVVLVFAGIAGLLFRRFGLSAIVGYLIAGMIIGPHTPPFSLVSDVERVHTLSQFGLAFLMFFVGLELSLSRIRSLGFSLVWATALLSWLVFNLCQFFAYLMGWNEISSFVFASMFVVSSSAIISKMILEGKLSHERYAQNALGITVLEDVVVIILLTLLSSQVQISSAGGHGDLTGGPGKTLALFAGFVVLSVVVGILFLPKILKRFNRAGDMDLKVIIVAGMVFTAAVATGKVGFSPALGAFLFGVVVSGTSFKHKIEKALMGTQDIFSAVFFASIGMLIDVRTVSTHLGLVLGVTAFIIPIRILAAVIGFLVSGNPMKAAIRSALILTPIGEFSYIMAQVGVSAGVGVPSYFYVIAVGSSILTSIVAPFLVRYSEPIADFIINHQPAFLRRMLGAYQFWLQEMVRKKERVLWWRLTAPRLGQLAGEFLLLAGVLIYSAQFQHKVIGLLHVDESSLMFGTTIYWSLVGVVALILFVAIWRNMGALSMIYAEACSAQRGQARRLRPVIEVAIQTVGTVGLLWMVWMLFPVPLEGPWAGIGVFVVAVVFLVVFWRKLILWYSHFRYSLNQAMAEGTVSLSSTMTPQQSAFWQVQLAECVLPDNAACRMKSITELNLRSRFGCSIVEVERQGTLMTNPSPDMLLFAGDKLLLFGVNKQIKPTLEFLQAEDEVSSEETMAESKLSTVIVQAGSARIGKSLTELKIFAQTGVQVLGVEHGGQSTLNPTANYQLQAGDGLLILCNTEQEKQFSNWLNGE